jgi:hypothetical protein
MSSATRTRNIAQNTPKSFSAISRNAIPTGMIFHVTVSNTIVKWLTATIEHSSYLEIWWVEMDGGAFDINVVLPPEIAKVTLFWIPREPQRSSVRTMANANFYMAATQLSETRDSVLSISVIN